MMLLSEIWARFIFRLTHTLLTGCLQEMPEISAAASFRSGAINLNTWLLYIQYACCFGVELTVNNAAVTYFVEKFKLPIESASAIASVFGFMNLFARGFGGYFSDKANARFKMHGRILVQAGLLILEGICIFIFAEMNNLAASIVMLTIFSIFVQGAEGSTYGIVPYVDRVELWLESSVPVVRRVQYASV